MTTQASPASIKSRFACKAQPQMQPYRMVRRASWSRRSDRAFHARHEIGHGIAVSVKSQDMRLTFYTRKNIGVPPCDAPMFVWDVSERVRYVLFD